MKPVGFAEQNVVFAKDQPQYLPLPAYRSPEGVVITCWAPSWKERAKIAFSGKIWLRQLTFNAPLQPQRVDANKPFVEAV